MTYNFDYEVGSPSVTRPAAMFAIVVDKDKSTAFTTDAKEALVEEVEHFWRENTSGQSDNFDTPVSYLTYSNALFFLRLLPLAQLPQEVLPISEDGFLSFEWNNQDGRSLSIVIADEKLFFAALLNNGSRLKGSAQFDGIKIPTHVVDAIKSTLNNE
ncbi:hypothetical protein AZI85_00710 [Bdellovibrio bacteriovorus]|uniref:Uncharacterized protein n=1 Tax=Bdellovibrio bacteriovorus TaxID=959 RepID=A0A150WVE0_BDEBC|nr:hypothetical protein [Bdellovibrio bacteriovorus]KYG70500.1 hypothetical protein AZI85_00710 [Bdellovibrio bacteriovorus]